MKLFKHCAVHVAPKDWKYYTLEYLIADNEQQVWQYMDEQHDWTKYYEPEYDTRKEDDGVALPDRIKAWRGDINDPDLHFPDAYYGGSAFGWDEGVDITPEDAEVLIRLGLAKDIR